MSHIFRVSVAVVAAGFAGLFALVALSAMTIWRALESIEFAGPDEDFSPYSHAFHVFEQAVRNMPGGASVFFAAGIACVLLSEIFRTRSLLYYAGAAGASATVAAAALSPSAGADGLGEVASAIAAAGFVTGAVYWVIAGRLA